MMAEINREKTFTANNNNNGEQQSVDDDDDDVVVGRLNTPQSKNGQKPVDSYGKGGVPREQSIPSRPASGLGSHQSVSPEPRSPSAIQQQQQQFNNNNRPGDFNEVQRPAMRQSPEDMNRSKVPPNIQNNLPFTKPNLMETADMRKGAQDMKKSVELDLGRPVTFQSAKHHSPSKIVHDFLFFFL
jgi:hypothetical protein